MRLGPQLVNRNSTQTILSKKSNYILDQSKHKIYKKYESYHYLYEQFALKCVGHLNSQSPNGKLLLFFYWHQIFIYYIGFILS